MIASAFPAYVLTGFLFGYFVARHGWLNEGNEPGEAFIVWMLAIPFWLPVLIVASFYWLRARLREIGANKLARRVFGERR